MNIAEPCVKTLEKLCFSRPMKFWRQDQIDYITSMELHINEHMQEMLKKGKIVGCKKSETTYG